LRAEKTATAQVRDKPFFLLLKDALPLDLSAGLPPLPPWLDTRKASL
jgi:hypothetical protein